MRRLDTLPADIGPTLLVCDDQSAVYRPVVERCALAFVLESPADFSRNMHLYRVHFR